MRQVLYGFGIMLAGIGAAYAARKPVEAELNQISKYCYTPTVSMAEGRECAFKQAARIRRELEKAVRKRHFEIDEVARKSPDDGAPNGKEDAARWRASFTKEQSSWSEYEQVRCRNVLEFENAGGSGAGGDASKCSMRLMLERLREIEDGY